MKPEHVIRYGAISASVFVNDVETSRGTRSMRNVKLQRRYRDGEEWKTSSSFTLTDLPVAIVVLQQALTYVAGKEACLKEEE